MLMIASLLIALVVPATALEPASLLEPAEAYRILRAWEPFVTARTIFPPLTAAKRSLMRKLYSAVLREAERRPAPSAADLWAAGECHAALGDTPRALASFQRSLNIAANPDAHLGLARLLLSTEIAEADRHFAEAARLEPLHRDLKSYCLLAARTFEARRDWNEASRRLELYVVHRKALAERKPPAAYPPGRAAFELLDQYRRFAAMMNEAAPAIGMSAWVQGPAVELTSLAGRVVVIHFDNLAWRSGEKRLQSLQDLQERIGGRGVEVIGLVSPELDAAERLTRLRESGIRYRVGLVNSATLAEYGVLTAPQTVVLDVRGRVRLILPGSNAEVLEQTIRGLLKPAP
jgi:tetratricopeptide (TPR) repeat protein